MKIEPVEPSPPIFIVGPPRSGTSLLSALIGSHSRIACGPETDLFRAFPLKEARKIAQKHNWRKSAVRRLENIKYPDGESLATQFGLGPDQLMQYLDTQPGSVRSIYSVIPALFAKVQDKVRWAEKTPSHLFYVDQIREEFPDAKIIRIIRDPRDSIPSFIKNIGLSSSYVGEFYRWTEVYTKSNPLFEHDAQSMTVRYEDLVSDPEKEVKSICSFIGENFEPEMLNRAGAEHVRVASETWKQDIDKKITAENIYAWKKRMDPNIARAASLICYEALQNLGYPDPIQPSQDLTVFPLGANFGIVNQEHIIDCAKKGYRYRPYPKPYPNSISEIFNYSDDVLLGDLPLGKRKTLRIANSINVITRIVLRYLKGKPVSVDPHITLGIGTLNRIVGKVALMFGVKRSFLG